MRSTTCSPRRPGRSPTGGCTPRPARLVVLAPTAGPGRVRRRLRRRGPARPRPHQPAGAQPTAAAGMAVRVPVPQRRRAGEGGSHRGAAGPVPDDELLATQLARLDRRAEAAQAERRRLADLYQAGVIEAADLARRAAELESRRRRLDDERETLVAQRAELTAHNRLNQRAGGASLPTRPGRTPTPTTRSSPPPRTCCWPPSMP